METDLKAGDYVRWYYPKCDTWVEGELVEHNPGRWHAAIRADRKHTNLTNDPPDGAYRVGTTAPSTLKRIERPGAAAVRSQADSPKPARAWHTDRTGRPQMHWECFEVKYDGVNLRLLLEQDEMRQRTERPLRQFEPLTPTQRSAVSAHWSAELRRKVAESAAKERNRIRVDIQDVDDL